MRSGLWSPERPPSCRRPRTRATASFNEVRAVEPGKTLPRARGQTRIVLCFNEVRAVEPGKTFP